MSLSSTRIRPGNVVEYENGLWVCLTFNMITPGRRKAIVEVKMRNIRDGVQKVFRFSPDDSVEKAVLNERPMQFLYADDVGYHFMDNETYDQVQLNKEVLGESAKYLIPDRPVSMTFYEGNPIGIELPARMTFKVTQADPDVKGGTATAVFKNATIETGMTVQVPSFIKEGDSLVINTETGEYMERAKA